MYMCFNSEGGSLDVIGKYHLDRILGRGSYGAVYLVCIFGNILLF
jgi:hypothetical protein